MKYTEVCAINISCGGCVAENDPVLCSKFPACNPLARADDQDIIYIIDPDGEIEVSE